MKQLLKILICIIFYSLPFTVFAQKNSDYENEEIIVINQLLPKLIHSDELKSRNDGLFILYFNKRLACNLNKESYKYKSNNLLRELEYNKLGERDIDTSSIKKINGVFILFEGNGNNNLKKYEVANVIGSIEFSRISFNKSYSTAYLYYSIYCGEDCGRGCLIKIEKKNGFWTIIGVSICYVS